MSDDVHVQDPFGPPFALEGSPLSQPLTKGDLDRIKGVLENAQATLAGPDTEEPAHCLVVAGYLGPSYGRSPAKTTEDALLEVLERHFGDRSYPSEPPAETIHVILESLGGSLDSAFKVVLHLRAFARDLRVYVPHRAKSAATLIALGADQVVMSPFGELGPLDTQITDPRNPSKLMSALDCYRSVDYVREFGVNTISQALKVMLSETRALIPLEQLIDSATTFAIGSVRPMLDRVSGLDFGGWGRTLSIGETYATELRQRLRHPDTEEKAKRIAWHLVYGYPHHPYPIDRAEAAELGLNVTPMTKEIYAATQAVRAEGAKEPRFVGFLEDAEEKLRRFEELDNGGRLLAPVSGQPDAADTTPHATVVQPSYPDIGLGPVSPSVRGPISPSARGPISDE